MLGLGCVPVPVMFAGPLPLSENPRWLLARGWVAEARADVQRGGTSDVEGG